MSGASMSTATVLVTDLVGSTELRARVGEDAAHRLERDHERILKEAVQAHGGRIVKLTGDGIVAVFTSAVDGVSAAVTMQRAVDARNREAVPARVAMRIGVSVGDVTFQGDECYGAPLIEAQRLESRANGGQILCSELVRAMTRGRGSHSFRAVGEVVLKGIREPVDACEVDWAMPPDSRRQQAVPFVGRREEFRRLERALERAASGTGGLVLVSGEPGIGKTRLMTEFGAFARRDGDVVLSGSCHDAEATPYEPFADAVAAWMRAADAEVVRARVSGLAPALSPFVPAIVEVLGEVGPQATVSPDESRARLHDAVAQLLVRLGSDVPAVILLDDLQWADAGTTALLRCVAARATTSRLLLLGSYREGDLDGRSPFAQALPGLRHDVEPERITLNGLGPDDVRELLETMARHDVPQRFAEAFGAMTSGNPLFIRETILHLVEEGKVFQEDGRWTAREPSITSLGIPEGVRDVIGRRVARLGPDAVHFLRTASAFDGPFPFEVVRRAAELDTPRALDALDDALASRFLEPGPLHDSYVFTHAMSRQTLYADLNPSRQVRLHRLVADAMADVTAPSSELAVSVAHHFHRSAVLPGAERGLPYALAAADRARSAHAYAEEAAAVRMAIDLLPATDDPHDELRCRLVLALSAVPGDQDETVRLCGPAAEALASKQGPAAAADFVAEVGLRIESVARIRPVWDVARIGRRYLGDRRDATWVRLRFWEISEREAEGGEGIPLDTPERRELNAVARGVPYVMRPSRVVFYESREEILVHARDDPGLMTFAAGEYREASPAWRRFAELLEGMGAFAASLGCWSCLARCENALGDFEAAERTRSHAEALVPRVSEHSDALLLYAGALLGDRALTIDTNLPALAAFADRVIADSDPDNAWLLAPTRALLAAVRARLGQPLPEDHLEKIVRAVERAPGWAPGYLYVAHYAADALWFSGRSEFAESVERNVRTKVVDPDFRHPMTDGRQTVGRLCALRGRYDEAAEWFGRARATLGEQGAVPLAAVVDFDEALMYSRRGATGDASKARDLLSAATREYESLGLTGWTRRAAELARSLD